MLKFILTQIQMQVIGMRQKQGNKKPPENFGRLFAG
jgi:hypothetical protein